MSKDAFYFKHDCNARNDEKLLAVRRRYGMEGYGIYWAIIEKLREGADYKINADYNSIAWELRVRENKIKSIVEDFGLFNFENGLISSTRLLDDMEILDRMRRGGRKKKSDNKPPKQDQNNQPHGEGKESQTPRKPRQKKYSDSETELHSKCKSAFSEIYRQVKGEEFVWSAKEMVGVVRLIADIKCKMKEKGFDIDNNDIVADNFASFINLIFIRADDWVKRNAVPTVIHSKFNEIYTTIANKTANGNKQTSTNTNGCRAIDNQHLLARIAAGLQPDAAE